jgi:outer membrane receptor protein involved in Fe transport
MSSKKALLGTSILAGVLALSALPAYAQTAPAPQEQETQVDEIVVTGSRLRRENFDTPVPVTQISSEEFEQTAVGNAIDVIEDVPLVGFGSNSRGVNDQFGANASFIDLFNLGSNRSLTLVNGRRFISGNQGTVFVPDNATGAQVDITALPPSLIARTEITPLTGGAIYGADAVGGVVNFILKDDFDGLDLLAQYGVTEQGDGERYRGSITWGKNFYDDRANVTLALDYYEQGLIQSGGDRPESFLGGAYTNAFNGFIRNTTPFNAASAADTLRTPGGALPTVFLPAGSDFARPTTFNLDTVLTNGLFSAGGLLTTGYNFPSGFGGATPAIPAGLVSTALSGRAADPQGFAFFAPSALPTGVTGLQVIQTLAPGTNTAGLSTAQTNALGLQLLQRSRPTPAEYFAANPGLNPLLFLGTFNGATGTDAFGGLGIYPTIPNTNPATAALFPRIAVPLQFDPSGNLVPYNVGSLQNGALLGTGIGGDGFSNAARGYGNLQSSLERTSLAGMTRFDVTDSITYRGEYLYSDISYRSVGAAPSNGLGAAATGGGLGIPIFINQNPFLNAQARSQIATLRSQGLVLPPQIGGQDVLYITRSLSDVIGGPAESGLDTETFRTAQSLEGEFGLFGRRFYWDASYVYGQIDSRNIGENFKDIEFALATDVVTGANGQPVCRQQTLAAPESIALRNPPLANINTTLSLTPTAAQVAACVPLNLFGENNAGQTQAARDYVIADTGSFNEARQNYLQAAIGGEIFKLPAGWINAGAQLEWRNESLDFTPSRDFGTGAARNATGAATSGEIRFLEYGYEVSVPIFSDEFNIPLFRALELNGAYRIVDRDVESSTSALAPGEGTTDEVYTASLRWAITEDIALRANKATSVRSASIIELVGSPGIAFTNPANGGVPCTVATIGSGPNPANRRANCIAAAIAYGVATDAAGAEAFLATYQGTGGARIAGVTGNPLLANEEAESEGVGFTFTPRFIPRLTISGDYYKTEIVGQIGLVGPGTTINQCFDVAPLGSGTLNGIPACDTFLIGVRNSAGNYIVPTVNPITGSVTPSVLNPGGPAVVNQPFESTFFTFANLNLGATRLSAFTLEARYNFSLDELFGSMASNWGDIFLSTSIYNLNRFDTSGSGTFTDTNKGAGEPGFAEWETRLDISHRIGRFDHRLTWNHTSETVGNVQTNPATIPEQGLNFVTPGLDFFNYTAAYEIKDGITARVTVNNLFDEVGPLEDLLIASDTIGRTYLFTLTGSF